MIETLTNPQNIVAALVAIAVFATMVTFIMPIFDRDNMKARMKSVSIDRARCDPHP